MAKGVSNMITDIIQKYKDSNVSNPESRVFLAGKSQGALLSLYIQMNRLKEPLGGVGVFEGSLVPSLMSLLDEKVSDKEA